MRYPTISDGRRTHRITCNIRESSNRPGRRTKPKDSWKSRTSLKIYSLLSTLYTTTSIHSSFYTQTTILFLRILNVSDTPLRLFRYPKLSRNFRDFPRIRFQKQFESLYARLKVIFKYTIVKNFKDFITQHLPLRYSRIFR